MCLLFNAISQHSIVSGWSAGLKTLRFGIDLRPETKGHIYFYDTEGFDGQKFEEMIYKIANSFTEFIENLKDESEIPELQDL